MSASPSTDSPSTDAPASGSTEAGVLDRFLQQIVVDEYAAVAPSPAGDGRGRPGWLALLVLLVIGVLTAVAVLNARAADVVRQENRAALVERITALNATVDARQAEVDARRAEVEALTAGLLSAQQAQASDDELAQLAGQAGTGALAGPGLTITVDDAADAAAGSLNTVLDRDLQDVVNALWRLGARGIAINGQRLTSGTAIRSAGEAILVNYQPLARPYRIEAEGLLSDGGPDSGLSRLLRGLSTDYGLVTEVALGDVALPAGELRAPQYAEPVEGSTAP